LIEIHVVQENMEMSTTVQLFLNEQRKGIVLIQMLQELQDFDEHKLYKKI